jgi:hypothetical protein
MGRGARRGRCRGPRCVWYPPPLSLLFFYFVCFFFSSFFSFFFLFFPSTSSSSSSSSLVFFPKNKHCFQKKNQLRTIVVCFVIFFLFIKKISDDGAFWMAWENFGGIFNFVDACHRKDKPQPVRVALVVRAGGGGQGEGGERVSRVIFIRF